MNFSGEVTLEEIEDIAVQMSTMRDGPYPFNDVEEKEREVIHSNRVKLTDYIHDPTVLFPYMKESDVFSVFDCEIIKGEAVPHNKVDKFLDLLLTKGPKAIGVFHEALGKTYPGLFDYLTRLFTSKGIDLPESRRMRPASQADHSDALLGYETAADSSTHLTNATSGDHHTLKGQRYSSNDIQEDNPWKKQMSVLSRRGMTVRRSLDLLSKQLETIQTERNELKNTLSEKEKEISDLLKSKEKNHDDLLSITQHYQDLSKELLHLRETLSMGGTHRVQIEKMAVERESIQAEYDALENDYTLVQLELRAARERIIKLMGHLERSESLVAFAQEERDAVQHKLNQLEGQLQREERKQIRIREGTTGGRSEIDFLHKQIEKFQKDLEQSRNESVDLTERLKVARHERSQALDEKDEIVKKMYLEEQARKKAENEVKQLRKQLKDHDSHSSDGSFVSYPYSTTSDMIVEMEDFTTVMQVSENMGMTLGLGVIVTNVSEGGLAGKSGLKNGDQLFEVNHIDVTSDRDPLDLCKRLLHNASNLVTLLIRRPIIINKHHSNNIGSGTHQTLPSRIIQMPSHNDNQINKSSTIERFQLPLTDNSHNIYGSATSTPSSGFVTSPCSMMRGGNVPSSLGFSTLSSNTSATTDGKGDLMRSQFSEMSSSGVLNIRKKRTKARYLDSDDGLNGSVTSSSDDGKSERSEGLIHSPIHNHTMFDVEDIDIPSSVTRPPTIVGCEELFGDSTEFPQSRQDTNTTIKPIYLDPNTSRPAYQQMISSPASFSPPDVQPDSPHSLRRQKARKWQQGQRRSQSLVDMPDNLTDRAEEAVFKQDEIQMLQMRRIVLPWGKLSDCVKMVGGRGRGIFFHTLKPDTKGLKSGDQLIKIGSVIVGRMTYADAVLAIQEYCQKGEQCMITVHANIEAFSNLPSLECRDNFYIKTLFSYKQQISPGELLFAKGDIFHVYDTLPDGAKDFWHVKRVTQNGDETEEGNIPLVHKLSSWMAAAPSSFSTSLPSIFRIAFSNKRLGSATGTENYDIDIGRSSIYDLYQPVRRIHFQYPRPVVILGIGDNEVTQALHNESLFSLPPVCTLTSLAMIEDQCSNGNVILRRTGENIRYCKVADVHSIAQEEQHCLLFIDPSQLKNTSLTKLHPIVIFLHTTKPNNLSKVKIFKTSPETVQKYLIEVKSLEEDYSNYFTCRIEFSGQLETVVKQVKLEIRHQQDIAVWEEDTSAV